MRNLTGLLLLRWGLAVIFLSHSLHGIFTNHDVADFGHLFLDQVGFAPFGMVLAWGVVLTQVVGSGLLLLNRYLPWAAGALGGPLLAGIALIHFREGWFVVGAGRNGTEFSFLLIVALLAVAFPHRVVRPVGRPAPSPPN